MVLTQEQFLQSLQQTSGSIRLLDSEGQHVGYLTHEQAAACFASGNYKTGWRKSRVRYLQALTKDVLRAPAKDAPASPADPSFWNGRHLWTWTASDYGKHALALDGLPA